MSTEYDGNIFDDCKNASKPAIDGDYILLILVDRLEATEFIREKAVSADYKTLYRSD